MVFRFIRWLRFRHPHRYRGPGGSGKHALEYGERLGWIRHGDARCRIQYAIGFSELSCAEK